MSDHGWPPPTARVAAAAQHGMLGQYLGSEAPPTTKTSWIGGLLAVVTVLLGFYGCLAIATDVMPLRDGWLLSLIVLMVAGLGSAVAWLIRSGAVVHCFRGRRGRRAAPGPWTAAGFPPDRCGSLRMDPPGPVGAG